jgi:solute carrier family 35 protein E3
MAEKEISSLFSRSSSSEDTHVFTGKNGNGMLQASIPLQTSLSSRVPFPFDSNPPSPTTSTGTNASSSISISHDGPSHGSYFYAPACLYSPSTSNRSNSPISQEYSALLASPISSTSDRVIDLNEADLLKDTGLGFEQSAKQSKTLIGTRRMTFWYGVNIASAVGIVLLNKCIYATHHFRYGVVLTFYHFALTAIGLRIIAGLGMFKTKTVSFKEVWPLSVAFCSYVVLTNTSLQYNSGTFYQILVVPVVAILQYLIFGIKTESVLMVPMVMIHVGVGLATVSEIKASWIGLLVAFGGVLTTAVYQILVSGKQKALGVNAIQLLYYQAPLSAAILMGIAPFMHSLDDVLHFPYTDGLVLAIGLSALCAFFLNLSMYLVLSESTALTYSVIGLSKLFLVLMLNYLVFESAHVTFAHGVGVLLAFSGMCSYSYIKYRFLQRNILVVNSKH